jgi:hypothetical protein
MFSTNKAIANMTHSLGGIDELLREQADLSDQLEQARRHELERSRFAGVDRRLRQRRVRERRSGADRRKIPRLEDPGSNGEAGVR